MFAWASELIKKHAFVLLGITSYLFQPPEKQQNQGPARPLRVPPSPTARPRDQPDRAAAGEALRQPAPLGRPPARQVEFCFLFPIARHQPQQPHLKDFHAMAPIALKMLQISPACQIYIPNAKTA